MASRKWGILPVEAVKILKKEQWDNETALSNRLNDLLDYPIVIDLNPPRHKKTFKEVGLLQDFIDQWNRYEFFENVSWETINIQDLGVKLLPSKLVISDFNQLIDTLVDIAKKRLLKWRRICKDIAPNNELNFHPALISSILEIEKLSKSDLAHFNMLISKIKTDRWDTDYVRNTPVEGLNVEFLKKNEELITEVLNERFDDNIDELGGLLSWLGYEKNNVDDQWVYIRPLSDETASGIGFLPTARVLADDLQNFELPATNILVIQNPKPGFSLPKMEDTIAVFGVGKNTDWLLAEWVDQKNVIYWGDIDSEGLHILDELKQMMCHIKTVMMDFETLERFAKEGTVDIDPELKENMSMLMLEDQEMILESLVGSVKEPTAAWVKQESIPKDYADEMLEEALPQVMHRMLDEALDFMAYGIGSPISPEIFLCELVKTRGIVEPGKIGVLLQLLIDSEYHLIDDASELIEGLLSTDEETRKAHDDGSLCFDELQGIKQAFRGDFHDDLEDELTNCFVKYNFYLKNFNDIKTLYEDERSPKKYVIDKAYALNNNLLDLSVLGMHLSVRLINELEPIIKNLEKRG